MVSGRQTGARPGPLEQSVRTLQRETEYPSSRRRRPPGLKAHGTTYGVGDEHRVVGIFVMTRTDKIEVVRETDSLPVQ
jgi:hypothetical protein